MKHFVIRVYFNLKLKKKSLFYSIYMNDFNDIYEYQTHKHMKRDAQIKCNQILYATEETEIEKKPTHKIHSYTLSLD